MDSCDSLPRTLVEAVRYFAEPDNCLSYLVSKRWPRGVACPVCGSRRVHFDKTRMGWRCVEKHSKRRFTLKTGTIFEDSPLGLDKWLPCVWMIANMKNGVSSWEIHRSLGVTQKTAWFMLHRIRLAMQTRQDEKPFRGAVEADETYIGGRAKFMHAARRAKVLGHRSTGHFGKTAVFGLLERHGNDQPSQVRAMVVPNIRRRFLQTEIRKNVRVGSMLYTDALKSYEWRTPKGWRPTDDPYIHEFIDHTEAYVNGQVHTNGCENFWSLLKRGLKGTYIAAQPFHLFRYVDEQVFRFNSRKECDADRFADAVERIVGKRLTYAALIGEGKASKN